jgi:hypothetical protein
LACQSACAKPLDSHTEEVAKGVARHENLDKIVEEARHVTNAAEQIKASLSQGIWDQPQRWAKRLHVYANLLGAIQALTTELEKMSFFGGIQGTR